MRDFIKRELLALISHYPEGVLEEGVFTDDSDEPQILRTADLRAVVRQHRAGPKRRLQGRIRLTRP